MRMGGQGKRALFILTSLAIYFSCLFNIRFSSAAPRGLEDQFAATLIVNIAALMPKNIQQLFVRYEQNLWDGYKFEHQYILQNQNIGEFNSLKEIDEKENIIIKWLQNYREAQTSPDYKLTRKMDRIIEEHGRLIKNIEYFYRERIANTSEYITKMANSNFTITYKGYSPQEPAKVSNMLMKNISSLQRKPSIGVGDFYQSVITSCMDGILNVHLKAGAKIDVASLANQTIVINNKLNVLPPPGGSAAGYAGTICDGLYSLCMAICRGSSCGSDCGEGYSECLDAASGLSELEYY